MRLKKSYKKGMVFGVFDTFHKGHEYFLTEAENKCHELAVVVALSEVVELMKKKLPQDTLGVRIENIKKFNPALNIVVGDRIMGEWSVLKLLNPDIVFLGYDQERVAQELDKLNVAYVFIDSYYPEKYKSSFFRNSK